MLLTEQNHHRVESGFNRFLSRSWWNTWRWLTDPWCRNCGEEGNCSLQLCDLMRDSRHTVVMHRSFCLRKETGVPHGLELGRMHSWSMRSYNCVFNSLMSAEDIRYRPFSAGCCFLSGWWWNSEHVSGIILLVTSSERHLFILVKFAGTSWALFVRKLLGCFLGFCEGTTA